MKKLPIIFMVLALIAGACIQGTGCYRSHRMAGNRTKTQLPVPPAVPKEEPVGSLLTQKRNEALDEVLPSSSQSPTPAPVSHVDRSSKPRGHSSVRSPLYADHARVEGEGEIVLLVSRDPCEVNRQKFLVRLDSGDRMLIVRDTTQSKRIEDLKLGERVAFCGEYFFGQNGDEIRIVQREPEARRGDGWVKHNGQTYP